jgi:hypothetical protein
MWNLNVQLKRPGLSLGVSGRTVGETANIGTWYPHTQTKRVTAKSTWSAVQTS